MFEQFNTSTYQKKKDKFQYQKLKYLNTHYSLKNVSKPDQILFRIYNWSYYPKKIGNEIHVEEESWLVLLRISVW